MSNLDKISSQGDQGTEFNFTNRAVKSIALSLSRRNFLKTLLAGTAGLGMELLGFRNFAFAATCNTTQSASCCGCPSRVRVCSPDGRLCVDLLCYCAAGLNKCGQFRAKLTVCNGGTYTYSCPRCSGSGPTPTPVPT